MKKLLFFLDKKLIHFVLVLSALACLNASICLGQGTTDKALVLKGASTTSNLIQPWIAGFEREYPGSKVVLYPSTHGKGFDDLIDGSADICMTARKLNSDEQSKAHVKKMDLAEVTLVMDAVAIIVNPSNPVKELSIEQLASIFNGKITNWKQVGGADESIQVIALGSSSGMESFLSKDVLKTPFTSQATIIDTPKKVPMLVKNRRNAIGFCRTALALAVTEGVKPIAVKRTNDSPAVELSKATVNNGSYPIQRPLGLCYDQKNSKEGLKDFVDFCVKKARETD